VAETPLAPKLHVIDLDEFTVSSARAVLGITPAFPGVGSSS
jgi:hypothetical protein